MGQRDAFLNDPVVTPAQIEAYRRDGFVVIENVLSPAEVQTLRQVTDELVEAAPSLSVARAARM